MATITPEVLREEAKRDTRGRRIVEAERWRELLAAYATSELTQAQFARREGVNYHTFVARLNRERGRSQPAGGNPAFIEARVSAAGLIPFNHGDYEPGRRFYFLDPDGIEYEVVSYA